MGDVQFTLILMGEKAEGDVGEIETRGRKGEVKEC